MIQMRLAKFTYYSATALLAVFVTGCIKDDIPYPRIQPNIVTMVADGQSRPAQIDSASRSVNLYFDENVDIENVSLEEWSITPGSELVAGDLSKPLDLSKPYEVTLRLYQDYVWTITGNQTIERYFTVGAQVGAAEIDPEKHTVNVKIARGSDLSRVYVETAKLGPVGCTYSPQLQGNYIDLSSPLEVDVTAYGRTVVWTITAEAVEATVYTTSIDAWTNVAWIYGEAPSDKEHGIEYRLKGETEWTVVPQSEIVSDGGSFYARLIHLAPSTTYEGRAFSGDDRGATIEFTTGEAIQLPNSDFEQWWLNGKVWNPWAENGTPYWDTGNKGATTLGQSNTVPTTDTRSGSGYAAMLQSKFVGISILGKLAAGNLFVGSYVRTVGTNGILDFGRPFTMRPTKLKGWFKYKTATINYASKGFEDMKGRDDTGIIWVALIDQDAPFEIRTDPNDRHLFDENDPMVIAYGKIEIDHDVDEYTPFEIELNYRSTSRVPKYLLVTASASMLGDYFTGADGAVLYLDDFELVYDY